MTHDDNTPAARLSAKQLASLELGRIRGGRQGADAQRAARVKITLPVAPWEAREKQEAEG